ncbi:MAG: glycosyltransferase family 39 protein [Terriglobales bacterium]
MQIASAAETKVDAPSKRQLNYEQLGRFVYLLAALAALSLWFLAIRAPLWLDETGSYWSIAGGLKQIWARSRELNSFPAYFYILWLTKAIFGAKELTLRIPSILAMLGAVYLLYRAARELFDQDVAVIAAILFCVHPLVIFAAIDVRPYAFAVLAVNATIFVLVRLRRDNSTWLSALFGFLAASIVYFHFLFAVILPAFAVAFVAIKIKSEDRNAFWRQSVVALAVFSLAFLPLIPGLLYELHTSSDHVFEAAPKLADLGWTLAPEWLAYIFVGAVLIAAATRRIDLESRLEGWRILLCASLALVPILVLYGISVETSIHVFVFRYRLVAVPGIALGWAWLVNRIDSRILRLLFCVTVLASVAYLYSTSPASKMHGYSWKYALAVAEKNASADDAPVLICSDLPEADHKPMPIGDAVKDDALFSPLTYYKLSVPVVGLPRALNDDAIRIASSFVQTAAQRRRRFLALGFGPSYQTLQFLISSASETHYVRVLGTFDGVAVLEFTPHEADAAR